MHITAVPIFASKEIKTKRSALPLLQTHFYNECNETATELEMTYIFSTPSALVLWIWLLTAQLTD